MIYTSSGKQALSIICKYLFKEGFLEKKISEILVPKFMGTWVYSCYNQNIYTSTQLSQNTKLIHLYHQFGIPQKTENLKNFAYDKKLKIIEDCAHVLSAKKNNQILTGNIGDYTMFSFSKFTDCLLLGGVSSRDENFMNFSKDQIQNSTKILSFLNFILIKIYKVTNNKKFMDLNYSLYHHNSKPLNFLIRDYEKKIIEEKKILSKRYICLKEELGPYIPFDYIQLDELQCNFFPIVFDKNKIQKIHDKMNKYNIRLSEMYFDKNREMLKPNYVKTIGISPASSNLNFEKSIDIIKNFLKND